MEPFVARTREESEVKVHGNNGSHDCAPCHSKGGHGQPGIHQNTYKFEYQPPSHCGPGIHHNPYTPDYCPPKHCGPGIHYNPYTPEFCPPKNCEPGMYHRPYVPECRPYDGPIEPGIIYRPYVPEFCPPCHPPQPPIGHCPPPPHCPEPEKVEVTQGRIWGDPHFVGADGGKYDVQGEAGKTYNILSDIGIQFNATFKEWRNPGTTVVDSVGISTGQHEIQIAKDGTVTIDGGMVIDPWKDGSYLHGLVEVKDGKVTVNAGEYSIEFSDFKTAHGGWINNIEIRSENANSDGVLPSGLWGATVDGDGEARHGDRGKGTQGGGAIEGLDGEITEKGDKTTVKLYEVGGLFDTEFDNFNVYSAPVAVPYVNSKALDFNGDYQVLAQLMAALKAHQHT